MGQLQSFLKTQTTEKDSIDSSTEGIKNNDMTVNTPQEKTKPTVFWVVPDKFTKATRASLSTFSSELFVHKVVSYSQFHQHEVDETSDMIIYFIALTTTFDEDNFNKTREQILRGFSPSLLVGLHLSNSSNNSIPLIKNSLTFPFEQQVANNEVEISQVKIDLTIIEKSLFEDSSSKRPTTCQPTVSNVKSEQNNPTIQKEQINIFTPESLKLFCTDIKKKINKLGKECSIIITNSNTNQIPDSSNSKSICCYYMKDRVDEKLVEDYVLQNCGVERPALLLLISASTAPGVTTLIGDWNVVKLKLQREVNGNEIVLNYDACNNAVLDKYLKECL